MIKDKQFYKTLILIALPVALQGLISLSVVFLDDVMVGNIGSEAVFAGVTQANAITRLFTFLVTGLGGGASFIIAQYWGKKDLENVKSVFSVIFTLGLAIGIFVTAVIFLFPHGAMRVMTNNQEVITEGAKYLRIVVFSYIFLILTQTFVVMLRSVEIVRAALYVAGISFFINLGSNYLLIFGNESLNIPALGAEGAAYAMVFTRFIECLIIMIFTFKVQKRLPIKIKDLFRHDKLMWRDYAKHGLPIMAGDTQWGLVGLFQAVIIGRVSSQMIAANGITSAIVSLVAIFTMGLGSAACVIIGKTVGAGDYELTRRYSNTLQILFASFGLLACTILFFSRDALISLYEIMGRAGEYGGFDPETKALARTFLGIASFTFIGTFYHATCFTGINRGAGDGKFVFKVDMICGWFIVLPLAFVSGIIIGAPYPFIYLSTKIDQCFKWLIAFIRLRGDKWIRNVTR